MIYNLFIHIYLRILNESVYFEGPPNVSSVIVGGYMSACYRSSNTLIYSILQVIHKLLTTCMDIASTGLNPGESKVR